MADQTPGSELERAYLEPEPFQLQDEVTSLTRDLSASAGLFQRSLDMIGRLQEQLAAKPADDLAQACIAQLIESGAENYTEHHFEFTVDGEDVARPAVVTVQFSDRPSPHELRIKAEGERNTAQTQLAEAVGLLLDASDPKGPCIRYAAIKDFLLRYAQAEQRGEWHADAVREGMVEADAGAVTPVSELEGEWARRGLVARAEQQEAQGAQAREFRREFRREDRYIVIKRKDLEKVTTPMAFSLGELLKHLPKRECLVIESDWPEYEPTWAAIQARMTGQGAQAMDEERPECFCVEHGLHIETLQKQLAETRADLANQLAASDQDQVHQLAFEVGEPDEDGDGYHFSADQLEEFVSKLNVVRGAEQ